MIADLDAGHALTNRLDYTCALMAEDDRKGAFGIFARESVRI
jgi:hypothetical protein